MRSRPGFTLIELMVSMALTLFIMVILSQAFILALDTFSGLKGIGDLQQDLRVAATALRSDLDLYHFDGSRRVSDPDIGTNPPRQGFFMVYQGTPSFAMNTGLNPPIGIPTGQAPSIPNYTGVVAPNSYEGTDADGVASYLAANHVLYFTSRQMGNGYEHYYRAPFVDAAVGATFLQRFPMGLLANVAGDATLTPFIAAAPVFASPWAEIGYFLLQTGTTAEPENPNSTLGTPLYALYRAQFVVPTNTVGADINQAGNVALTQGINVNPATGAGGFASSVANQNNFAAISCGAGTNPSRPNNMDFYTPDDLANAQQPWPVGAPTTLRPTRTLAMVPTPGFGANPAVPPSLKWWTSPAGNVLLVPRAVNDALGTPRGLQMLPNVLSFHVQVMPKPDPRFTSYPYFADPEAQFGPQLPSPPTQTSPRLYDTGTYYTVNAGAPPTVVPVAPAAGRYPYANYPCPLLAVQVTIRVWDTRTQQARQLTIVQDL